MSQESQKHDLEQSQTTVTLPLFPLRLVLFPGQVLPLHIFEPRYRLMINQCVEKEEPFGVVLMRDDTPDWREYNGDLELPYQVGTTAHIQRMERLADGRLNIITLGLHRFRVRSLRFDMPFLQGEVESFPMEGAPAPQDTKAVSRLLPGYIKQLSRVLNSDIDLGEAPDDPHTLAFVTAAALQLPWDEKQSLLETPDLPQLLSAERALLGKETMLLGFMHASESRVEEQVLGPTGYLYPN
ncbi:MAG: LON peptidase substrate-binding domain-containing protein [Anaerolineae bacterium]